MKSVFPNVTFFGGGLFSDEDDDDDDDDVSDNRSELAVVDAFSVESFLPGDVRFPFGSSFVNVGLGMMPLELSDDWKSYGSVVNEVLGRYLLVFSAFFFMRFSRRFRDFDETLDSGSTDDVDVSMGIDEMSLSERASGWVNAKSIRRIDLGLTLGSGYLGNGISLTDISAAGVATLDMDFGVSRRSNTESLLYEYVKPNSNERMLFKLRGDNAGSSPEA